MSTTEEIANKADGYFYNTNGEFINQEGTSDKVYLAKGNNTVKNPETDEITIQYENCVDLNIVHDDFRYIGGIIKVEAGQNDLTEFKCIAFASYNESKRVNKTWKALMASTYSSVGDKKLLKDNKETTSSDDRENNNIRKAMIAVLTNETDITNGAHLWDGTDLLAWGTDENKYDHATKIGHNKFREYKFIEIPIEIYNTYLEANKDAPRIYTISVAHDMKKCSGKHEHLKRKNTKTSKEEYTGKIRYPMPATVFEDKSYWSDTCFYYDTKVNETYGISATIAAGKSIFWKLTKERLCTDSYSSNETDERYGIPYSRHNDITMPADKTRVVIHRIPLDLEIEKLK